MARPSGAPSPIRQGDEELIVDTWLDGSPEAKSQTNNLAEARSNHEQRAPSITISIKLPSGDISAALPRTTPEQLFYARHSDGLVLANDLRLLLLWSGLRLDARAVYALLQFGAVPPPLTISSSVQRLPNGYSCRLPLGAKEPVLEPLREPVRSRVHTLACESSGGQLKALLDQALLPVPRGSLLYFSGGVDSGLLASRLIGLGRSDVTLVNYSFGPADREAGIAREMAALLGMRLEQICYRPADLLDVILRTGLDYSTPIADTSVLPSSALVHRSLDHLTGTTAAIDGTGADAALGVGLGYHNWSKLYRLPNLIRTVISGLYSRGGLWIFDSDLARIAAMFRRSTQMGLVEAGVMSYHSLEGILFSISTRTKAATHRCFVDWYEPLTKDLAPIDRYIWAGLMHIGVARSAKKIWDPLRRRGVSYISPYMTRDVLSFGLSLDLSEKSPDGEYKGLVKKVLTETVPASIVYRRKVPFDPALHEVVRSPDFQDVWSDMVMSPANPILDFVSRNAVRDTIGRLQDRSSNEGVYQFLWALTSLSVWLAQVPTGPIAE